MIQGQGFVISEKRGAKNEMNPESFLSNFEVHLMDGDRF